MLTATQKKTAEAIINIFETSEVRGNYGQITLLAGDTGHLTFGRSQTTLGSGNLSKLLKLYCANPGARFAKRLAHWMPQVEAMDFELDHDAKLHNLLRASADDAVMRDTQDAFFDSNYWQPAERRAATEGIVTPLGVAVVYDSFVHGSWQAMRDRTNEQSGVLAALGEREWISAYVATRRDWLATHARSDLRNTTYRMDAFQQLVSQQHWNLELPLLVRNQEISTVSLSTMPHGCYDGPQPGSRALSVQTPLFRGLDVRLLQLGLSDRGFDVKADGVFGQASANLIKQYQEKNGLPATGVATIDLITQLIA
ncbi:MAG: peptidoglycan-binding protein [Nitrosomonas sp.]|nr:MAG: peptidoglycan-binding protein [Nitrosomonas sp.]